MKKICSIETECSSLYISMVARHSFVGRGEGGGKLQLSRVERKESKCALPSHSPPRPSLFSFSLLLPYWVLARICTFICLVVQVDPIQLQNGKIYPFYLPALGVFKKKISSFFFLRGMALTHDHLTINWCAYFIILPGPRPWA